MNTPRVGNWMQTIGGCPPVPPVAVELSPHGQPYGRARARCVSALARDAVRSAS